MPGIHALFRVSRPRYLRISWQEIRLLTFFLPEYSIKREKGKISSPYPQLVLVSDSAGQSSWGLVGEDNMKTINNIFHQVSSFENIHLAYLKARKDKRYKKDVLKFSFDLEENLLKLRKELIYDQYLPGGYREFIVHDSKKRLIKAPLFKDRVIHHALCSIIEPIFDRSFIFDSYACRKGKGSHQAARRAQVFMRKSGTPYYLKKDISKYFDSINHEILLSLIEKKVKDKGVIRLIESIIHSSDSGKEGVGIPIGNLTSQLFANIYLDCFDQFVKHSLRSSMYLRYMDDFIFFGTKKDLQETSEQVDLFLIQELLLKINPKKDIIGPSNKGLDFVGYVIFIDHILLRKSTVKRFLKKRGDTIAFHAYAKHADSYSLSKSLGFI